MYLGQVAPLTAMTLLCLGSLGCGPEAAASTRHPPPAVTISPPEAEQVSEPASAPAPPRRAEEALQCNGAADHTVAKGLFERGRRRFEEADYRQAALDFVESYRLSCKALLLFNAARAYQLLGDREAAARALRTGLARAENDDQRRQFERELKRLGAR